MREARLENACRGFSCPQEHLNAQFFELIAIEHARTLTDRFVARYGRHLDDRGDGVASLLQQWIARANGFEVAWDSSFGQIRQALLHERPSTVAHRAASLMLRLHACGTKGEWELRLDAPARLRMGRWLLPMADSIKVEASARKILVQSSLEGVVTPTMFWRQNGEFHAAGAGELPEVAAQDHKFTLLFANALDGMEFERLGTIELNRRRKTIVHALEAAIALLHRHAPIYLSWIDRVIRNIIPLSVSGLSMHSGSEAGHPGVIQMSYRGPPIALAELMVHEGTHLYMNLLCQLGEIDDGSDPTLYYSPVRKTGRPIRWIVIAYHAFANVLLLYRTCLANGLDGNRYCHRNERALVRQLKQLETALRTSRALTPLGHALWKPLAARIG